jgi:hypothetical protein
MSDQQAARDQQGSPDQQQAADRTTRQRTQQRYQAEVNQVQDEPVPASSHEQPRPDGVEQNEQQASEDTNPGGAVHELGEDG